MSIPGIFIPSFFLQSEKFSLIRQICVHNEIRTAAARRFWYIPDTMLFTFRTGNRKRFQYLVSDLRSKSRRDGFKPEEKTNL